MSQHYFTTSLDGRPAFVMTGWDRPLGGYYLVIEMAADADEPFYSSLNDEALLPFGGLAPTLEHFKSKLSEFGLRLPDRMIREIEADGAANVGNRHVWYDQEGGIVRCC
jgi:hypothetical protein